MFSNGRNRIPNRSTPSTFSTGSRQSGQRLGGPAASTNNPAGNFGGNQLRSNQETRIFTRDNQVYRETRTNIPVRIAQPSNSVSGGNGFVRTRRLIVNGQPVNEAPTIITRQPDQPGMMRIVFNNDLDGAGYGKLTEF